MANYNDLKKAKEKSYNETIGAIQEYKLLGKECERVADIAKNVNIIISDLDKNFEQATKLRDKDIAFLFLAVALQCIRQYVIGTITQRKAHNETDKLPHDIQKELFRAKPEKNESSKKFRERIERYKNDSEEYFASIGEIMYTPNVPYDATYDTKTFNVGGIDKKGNGIGLGGKTHRYKTLGHDPALGWIFGTANIMTNTLTNDCFLTFHVKNGKVISHGGYDKTLCMLEHVRARSEKNLYDLGVCLIKQGLHIASDTYSKEGIMLPGTVALNSDMASELAKYGIDFGNTIKVGGQLGFAILINQIIAMIHAMLFDPSVDFNKKLYSVRTKRIILNSNIIATTSNVIAVGASAITSSYAGNSDLAKKSLNYLDLGGMVETIRRVTTDQKMIKEIKQEYIEKEFYNIVMNDF